MAISTTTNKPPKTNILFLPAAGVKSADFTSCCVLMSCNSVSPKSKRWESAGSFTIGTVFKSSEAPRLVLMVFSKIIWETVTSAPGTGFSGAGAAAASAVAGFSSVAAFSVASSAGCLFLAAGTTSSIKVELCVFVAANSALLFSMAAWAAAAKSFVSAGGTKSEIK